MAETRASKSKGRKLDSIISKLKIHPSQEAIDTQNEPLITEKSDVKEGEKSNENHDVERKRSKRKSKKIVRYRIEDDDDDNDITDTTEAPVDGTLNQVEEKDSQLPETIFEDLPNGDTSTFDDTGDTTVLFLPADEIQVRAGPSDDYLGDLLEGGQDSHQEEEEETSKEKKKKKKKKKTYESDESLDEDGLPRRVMCTACGRNINPSHGTILRHPVLNVLVCKKCNQYYNSGPFTRDEYGIEEQCRWCGDGGDLICCDHCEKVYCKPCIQRNCGKTYLKNLLNAPDDYKWFCIVCQKDKPIKHIQRLRKKCDQVMQALENIKAQKAHFKSKKGQQTSVVIGPTTSERRNRLNCLSEGIKAEELSSSGESPTKKTFGKDAELPPELFSKIEDEASDKDNDEDSKSNTENESTKGVNKKQGDGMEGEDRPDSDSQTSRRRSLRSGSKDKNSEKKDTKEPDKVGTMEEEKQEVKCNKNDEEVNLISEGEETSEQPDKPKTRSQRKEQAKQEQEKAKDIITGRSIDNESSEEATTVLKVNKEKSKESQNGEPTEKELSEEVAEEDNETEEEVRVTRSGIKRIEIKPKTVESPKSTPQQSDEERNNKNKTKNKLKTIADKVKEENLTDEQDSSDSSSGRRPSRKSKDRANKLMIRRDIKKKTPPPKTIVVVDSSDENDNKEQEKISKEQPKEVKKSQKSNVVEKSKGKKPEVKTMKSEKSTTSDSSDSRIKKSRGKVNKKSTESKAKNKKDSNKDSCSDDFDSDANLSSIKNKLDKKKKADLSSDSDFETKKVSKKAASNKKKSIEQSSDSDTSKKVKSEPEEYSLEESSESDEESSESDSDISPKTQRSRGVQKQTRKRPRPVESSSDSQETSEDSSEDEGMAKRTRKRKQIESDSSEETAKTSKRAQNKRQKKTIKKGRKGRQKKNMLDSDESEVSDNEESSDSEAEEKTKSKKGKQKKKQKGKKPAQKKKRRRVKNKSDDESTDDDKEDKSPSKGRKKIRKILTDDKLGEETLKARRLEEERRKRLLERTRTAEDDEMPKESWHLNTVVLEKDKETKEPLVEIQSDLVQHLKPHQSKGIQFMYNNVIDSIEAYKKGDKGGGCILAHCMGLGKTLQVVSLIHTLHKHESFDFKTTLIIAPLNTVLNWQVEFDKWLNVDERMDVFVLKEAGHNNWHRADMLKQWQRYGGILIVGYDAYRNLSQCSRVRSKHQKKIFKEALVDPGPDLVVCDEGHILRNDQSAISKAVNSIKTRRRIVLTGTPLQNNLIEYHCMVSFVKPNLLGTRKEFMNLFGNPIMNGQCVDSNPLDVRIMKQSCHVLYKLLEACVQRRDYSVLTPFLPPKHEYVIKIRLSEVQRKLYAHYLNTFVYPEGQIEGSFSGRGASLFSDYQALMRIWTHPWCLKLEAIRRSLRAPYSDSDNSLDGFVVHTDEEEESENGSSSSDEISLKSDDSLPKNKDKKKNGEVFELKSSSDEESGNNTSDEEVMPQPSRRLTRSNGPIKIDDDEKQQNGSANADGESNLRSGNTFKEEVQEEKEWYDEFLTPEDEYNVELSGKMALLLEILADAEAVEEKVLVFSQSLVTLDLIERALGGGEVGGDRENWCRGCDYFRMDGSTSVQLRQRWADIFNDVDNKTARLFLISTKAGGLGINLVAANRVVVFDVSWNPSHDVQSIFRVYRFGQTKPVYVYRLVSEGAMEERIYDRQIAKLSTSQRVIDKHQIERHFTAADLAELYRFNPSVYNEETDKDNVPSLPLPKDAVLADLINRMHPKWIVKYHEHDSLLQNKTEEQLTDEECKQAWAAYEAQKNQAKQQLDARSLQAQYAQQQLEQQRQAVPSQNLNFSNSVLQQMQEFQRQQLSERMARMQADAAMQGRHYQLPPTHNMHNQQLRQQQQQLLQHLGAARPVYQPRPGTTYQPINLFIPQQQQQAHRMLPPRLPSTAQQNPQANTPQPNPRIVLRHATPPYSRM